MEHIPFPGGGQIPPPPMHNGLFRRLDGVWCEHSTSQHYRDRLAPCLQCTIVIVPVPNGTTAYHIVEGVPAGGTLAQAALDYTQAHPTVTLPCFFCAGFFVQGGRLRMGKKLPKI